MALAEPRASGCGARMPAAADDPNDAVAVLRVAIRARFPGRIALVSSFGTESAVLLHMVAAIDPATPVLFLETGRHFAETLAYRDRLVSELGLTDVRSIAPARQRVRAADPAMTLFDADPDLCCHVRKTEPLRAALSAFDAWITGRKRFQTPAREGLAVFEQEGGSPRTKVNPLAGWSPRDVTAYLETHGLPRHPLQAAGFSSIGCACCTARTGAPDQSRAGRWRGRAKTECGIHMADGRVARSPRMTMDVYRNGRFETDLWRTVGAEEPVPAGGPVLVTLGRWRAEREALSQRDAPVGVIVEPGDAVDDIAPDVARFPVIAIAFPTFTDGRGYSHARKLREQHGYRGELRAVGEVLIDQIPFLQRVGIDAFVVTDGPTRRRLTDGRVPWVTRFYQPAIGTETAAGRWSWRRHLARVSD